MHTTLPKTHQALTHSKLLRRKAFTQRKLLHTESFTHSKLLHKEVLTQRSFLVHNDNANCSSKTGSRCQSKKETNTILKHFFKGILKGKSPAPKWRKSADRHYRSLDAATPIRSTMSSCKIDNSITHAAAPIDDVQLQKTLVFPPQPKSHATFMQPLQCVLRQHVHIHAAITMRFASTRCRTPRRNRLRSARPWLQPLHAQGTLHRRPQPLYTEKHMVSCSGFLPKPTPCNSHAAITLRLVLFCAVYVMCCFVMYCYVMCCYAMYRYAMYCFATYCFVMYCYVMFCCVMYCYVMYCYVVYCYVMYCFVMYCFVMYC